MLGRVNFRVNFRVTLAATGAGLLLASGALAQVPDVLDCAGAFSPNASHASLVKAVGAAHAAFKTVPGPEGSELKATVLFDKDPKRRIEILWKDETARARPDIIRVGEGSSARTRGAIGIGATLADAERANQRAFILTGFDWDYGGTVVDWKGGALGLAKGCRVALRFEPSPGADSSKASGDQEFPSDGAPMKAAQPRVYEISLIFE